QAGAKHGQIVNVEITEYPTSFRQGLGRVKEVLGDHMGPGMEIDIAIRSFGIPEAWPAGVEDEISGMTDEVPEEAKVGREDIRHLPLVTIDGEDSRDFDDAVYVEPHGKEWKLYVAIADVSAYVTPHSALDKAAFERGNSVYFPERVVPMLPEILSNGLCSLNPDVDRLCMVCEMIIDQEGKTKSARFFEGLMRSHARLTYSKVASMVLDNDTGLRQQYQAVMPHIDNAYQLFKVLRKRRESRGAIDFDTTETRIMFGVERKIDQIVPVVRNDAHMLIEEFMIAANVATAEFLLENKIPSLYRVHEAPSMEKLEGLREFLAELGLNLGGGDKPSPHDYSNLLLSIQQRPDYHLISTVMLRSLRQAVYTPDNHGHFGLGFEAYTHFTSPIRRYPDLLIHRAIKHAVGKLKRKSKPIMQRAMGMFSKSRDDIPAYEYGMQDMLMLGEHCSMTERRADEATRDAVDWLKCEYMQDKVGEEYTGTVTAVTNFGLFVELKDIFVEGLIHVTALANDYYHFDPVTHRLVGERRKTIYRLGDQIDIKVVRVDLDERKIDFVLAGMEEETGDAESRPKKPKKRRSADKSRGKPVRKKASKKSARRSGKR
ncbi:MAG: ribonuclease R, partial [Gammaproteobacteria bacterium]|nr:ribonuclease R [Gammaproteobacteria bacterium]